MNIIDELLRSFHPSQDGYIFMWVLASLAVCALILIMERWLDIQRRTNVDAEGFSESIKKLIAEKKNDEAYSICHAAGKRALPRILGAGIKNIDESSEMIMGAMEEESLHIIPMLERRLNYVLMLGNVSTLLGLMGTIYGLILSFAAVARPDVNPVEKSSLLAAGISTAMNTTLFGLIISVPCIFLYSILRSKIDIAVHVIDRYSTSMLRVLLPTRSVSKNYCVSSKRVKEEVDTEPNIAPMMNLMVILIPLLLSSAEFIKIGAIELKLPEASQGGGDAGSDANEKAKLNLGIVVTEKGFNLYHYFKETDTTSGEEDSTVNVKKDIEIPLKDGKYDYEALNSQLAEIKRKVLFEIIKSANSGLKENATLLQLFTHYNKNDYSQVEAFLDHEDVKIVADETIKYEIIVAVMDAARGTKTPNGNVGLFPNVSLAGGMI